MAALMIAVSPLKAETDVPAGPPIQFVAQQNKAEVLGTDFIGTPVMTKSGQKIGNISNLVFGPDGRIELAVIGVGGFLGGVGAKDVAVPFDSVKSEIVNSKHVFVVDATKDEFKAAPAFKTLDDEAFNQRMKEWRAEARKHWAEIKSAPRRPMKGLRRALKTLLSASKTQGSLSIGSQT